MKRKPAENGTSSLEMLLDTMCNTFGGVCFIALTVCLILATLPRSTEEDEAVREMQKDEQMLIDREKAELIRQRDELKMRIETKREFIAGNTNAVVDANIVRDLQSNRNAMDKLKRDRIALEDRLAKMKTDAEYSKREAERLARLLKDLEEELNKPQKYPRRTVRTPVEREIGNLTSTDVVLFENRFYVKFDRNQVSCVTGTADDGKMMWTYTLKKDKGLYMGTDFCETNEAYRKVVRQLDARTYLRIYTDTKSFNSLCRIRDDLVKKGKKYNWHMNYSPTLEFVEGYDGRVQ